MSDGPFYGRGPADGFHVLKGVWCQKSHLGPQSKALAERLLTAIKSTEDAVPQRCQGYKLDRAPAAEIHSSEIERRLEAALLQRWSQVGMSPVPDAWSRLIAYQVPLFDRQLKVNWGYIDLLGVDRIGIPVVVELKKGPNSSSQGITEKSESPLRMVLEAAAYGVALRKNWTQFRKDWHARLQQVGMSAAADQLPETADQIKRIQLVGAAPAAYWIDWLPVTAKGREVSPEAWTAFGELLLNLEAAGLPMSFVSISGAEEGNQELAIQPLPGFPLIMR